MLTSGSTIPALRAVDSSLALWREGYLFVTKRCNEIGADAFRTRIMMREVIFMRGPAAAEQFYRPGRFTRRAAIPRTALALLQDWGSVQTLDGEAHHHR
jgi:fatty-acid peroxygenase